MTRQLCEPRIHPPIHTAGVGGLLLLLLLLLLKQQQQSNEEEISNYLS